MTTGFSLKICRKSSRHAATGSLVCTVILSDCPATLSMMMVVVVVVVVVVWLVGMA